MLFITLSFRLWFLLFCKQTRTEHKLLPRQHPIFFLLQLQLQLLLFPSRCNIGNRLSGRHVLAAETSTWRGRASTSRISFAGAGSKTVNTMGIASALRVLQHWALSIEHWASKSVGAEPAAEPAEPGGIRSTKRQETRHKEEWDTRVRDQRSMRCQCGRLWLRNTEYYRIYTRLSHLCSLLVDGDCMHVWVHRTSV